MLRGLLACTFCSALLCACAAERGPNSADNDHTLAQALAELDSLDAPAGLSAERFAELKGALAAALRASGRQRFTSAAPQAAAGAVNDLSLTHDGFDWVLNWTYRNKGDYDQNKQVTISDLTTLGANLGKGTASPDWLTKAIAADGDANGEVTISDITPIGANLMATVMGYVVQSSDTPETEGSWQDVDEIEFDHSIIFAESALRLFGIQLFPEPTPNRWYRVVPVDGTDRGAPSNAVQFSQLAPQVLAVNPTTGVAGTAVTFVPTYSGTPASWAWSFGGGATPNTTAAASPSVTLGATGNYPASVTVSNGSDSHTFDFNLAVVNPAAPVIEDVQPRGGTEDEQVTFVATLSGGSVETYAWDFAGAAIPATSSEPQPLIELSQAGQHNASLTVSNAGGSDTFIFVLDIASGPNLPPMASFTATPQHGEPAELVTLDASASFDSDGAIVLYEWDLDGDGSFEVNSGSDPLHESTLPDPAASVMVTLRVTDNDAALATVTLQLSSLPSGWYPLELDTEDAGRFPSLALIDGRPAISYLDGATDDLLYIRALNPEGSAWGAPVVVDSESDVGYFTSMIVVNGRPAISYYDGNLGDLLYVRAADPQGTTWGDSLTLLSDGIVGTYSSLAIVAGHPAIAYHDTNNTAAAYIRATDPDGNFWGLPDIVANEAFDGNYTSLAVIDGFPGISYTEAISGALKFVRGLTPEGSEWGVPQVADATSFAIYTSLLELDGKAAIAYCDAGGGDSGLKLVRATNPQGTAWNEPQLLDDAGVVGRFPSMAVIAGLPAIAYWDFTNTDVKFVQATAADGSAWGTPQTVSYSGVANQYTSLADINGLPAIAYNNSDEQTLRYTVLLP